MFFEFPGPLKSHDLQDLLRSDKAIKYPFVKRPLAEKEMSGIPMTPAERDLRTRSDFVFGVDWNELGDKLLADIQLSGITIAGLSSAVRSQLVQGSNLLIRRPPSVKLNTNGPHSLT